MFKKLAQISLRPQQIVNQKFGSHAAIPKQLPKVQQKTIRMNVKNSTGQWEQVLAFPGQSFLEALSRMNVRGISMDICQGNDLTYRPHERPHDPFSEGPHCGLCRIHLKGNWFDRVMEQTDGMTLDEQQVLLSQHENKESLRLACCIPIQKWMDGIELEIIPPYEIGGQGELF